MALSGTSAGASTISAPTYIWFQKVDDIKIVKNRLHLDINTTGGIGKDVPAGPRQISGLPDAGAIIEAPSDMPVRGIAAEAIDLLGNRCR